MNRLGVGFTGMAVCPPLVPLLLPMPAPQSQQQQQNAESADVSSVSVEKLLTKMKGCVDTYASRLKSVFSSFFSLFMCLKKSVSGARLFELHQSSLLLLPYEMCVDVVCDKGKVASVSSFGIFMGLNMAFPQGVDEASLRQEACCMLVSTQ